MAANDNETTQGLEGAAEAPAASATADADPPRPRYYDARHNPAGRWVPGVKLDDFTAEEWAALPAHLRATADASGWYRRTPVPLATDEADQDPAASADSTDSSAGESTPAARTPDAAPAPEGSTDGGN